MRPLIAVENQSTTVSASEFVNAIAAIQAQIREDFAPVWLRDANVVADPVYHNDQSVWKVIVKDVPSNGERHDARGWHGVRDGVPVAYVYAKLARLDQKAWTAYLSHEVLELLGDERMDTLIRVILDGHTRLWYREVCDPVMGTDYKVRGVTVANFVYPSYFIPSAPGPYDRQGKLLAPFEVLASGYATYLDPPSGLLSRQVVGMSFPGWKPGELGPPKFLK